MKPPYTGLSWFVKTTEQLAQSVAPDECLACGREGMWLCESCQSQLQIRKPTCLFCHKLTPKGQTCTICRSKHNLTGGIGVWYYQPPIDTAIRRIKYEGVSAALPFLYQLARTTDFVALPFNRFDVVTSVPCSPYTLGERGFNQSELLARIIATDLDKPYDAYLHRRADDTAQAGLSRKERITKSHDRFIAMAKSCPRRVLLIDDVITTGATLDSCAFHLRQMGAKEVWALALTRNILR